MALRIGDPREMAVLILVALVSDLDTLRAQLRNQSVEIIDSVIEHESRLARAKVGRVLLEEGPHRGPEPIRIVALPPLQDSPAAGLDGQPEVSAIPLSERVYITSAKESAAESRDSGRRRLVGAGLRGAGLVRCLEGLAAAAARDRVRVAEGEAAAHESVYEVDLRAFEVHGAHRVHDDANAVVLDDRVVVFGAVGERHPVRETRATTRCDVHAEREVLPVLLRENLAELVRRFWCQ